MRDPEHPAGGELSPARTRAGRWSGRAVPAAGLLPIRLFLGITYLYAGIDKFASPHFLAAGDPMNVAAQMHGYANVSPLASLVNAAMPMAIGIGALIALAELAIGLGLLTGLAFRLAASAGAALSLLFWLTASWSSTPYFFSPDLPYAFGFLTLALTGHAGLSLLRPFAGRGTVADASQPVAASAPDAPSAPAPGTRRAFLQVGLLAILTFAAAAVSLPLRALGYGGRPGGTAAAPTRAPATPAPTASATPPPAPTQSAPIAAASAAPSAAAPTVAPTAAATPPPATPAPPASAAASAAGTVMGNLSDFANGANGLAITLPMDAPFAAGPGGPGILVKLPDGSVAAYSAICTHGRCIVGWDASTSIIQCPCHTARFDPAAHAAVLSGPAPLPLPEVPVTVGADGVIHMAPSA